jgi:hypothetical protein
MVGNTSESVFLVKKLEILNEFSKRFLVKKRVLDHFFRCESLTNGDNSVIELSHFLVKNIVGQTHVPEILVIDIMNKFLKEVKAFSEVLRSGHIKWIPERKRLYRKVRVYLHKTYKIAPVFDYNRARKNLELLHMLLTRNYFWPQITTQLALVLFVTDRNDTSLVNDQFILQKNLRAVCSCSAYAFHRARNILGINKKGKIC